MDDLKLKSQNRNVPLSEEPLTREEQLKVIQWCVELRNNEEISELIADEFHKKMSRQGVWRYRQCKKWRPIIKRLRTRFEKNLSRIPIANKADRLRYLQTIVDEGLKWSLKTVTKDGDEVYELKLGNSTQAIREAREEMGEGTPLIDNSKHFYFTKYNDNQLIDEARKRGVDLPAAIEGRAGAQDKEQRA